MSGRQPGHRRQRITPMRWWSSGFFAIAVVLGLVTAPPAYPTELSGVGLPNQRPNVISDAPVDVAGPVEAGVVQITTNVDYQNVIGSGAGIVLNSSGEVLTNHHVVQGANRITATQPGTGRSFPVDVIGYDRTHDIALVQLGGGGLTPAPLGDSSQVAVGEPIVSLGNAGGTGNPLSRATGTVTGLNQTIVADDDLTGASQQLTGLIQVSAPLRPGDSGGPLVGNAGQVIGLNTAASANYRMGNRGGQGFAIPIGEALATAAQIRARQASPTVHIGPSAMLGIGASDARGNGVLVRDILSGTPAARAGLVSGDVITTIDGTAVNNATTLTNILDQHYPGDTVTVGWVDRSGAQRSAPITLAAGPTG